MIYDTIIIGGGPAGFSAAVYAARQKIKFILITSDFGGQVSWSSEVENYPGYDSISGVELTDKFLNHARKAGAEIVIDKVKSINKIGKDFEVHTDQNIYKTHTILIASGKKPRTLGISGEEEYLKKGITYCATCDGPVFKDKIVAVIGGGNSALDAALLLDKYARKIYLITINDQLLGDQTLINEVNKSKKIDVLYGAKTVSFLGDGKKLQKINYSVDGKEESLDADGAFIEIGSIPSVDFDDLTRKNRWNEIEIHEKDNIANQTSIKGIFAAGDVTDVAEKQVVIAAGEGVKAILGIFKYLHGVKEFKE